MADYSAAAESAEAALDDAAEGGLVQSYSIRGRSVTRGRPEDQIKAAAMLEGLAARRSSGLFRLAKVQERSS